MTVRAETPTHRISVTPDSRLDESATAVIVLQRGSLLFKYRPDWILKVTSLLINPANKWNVSQSN